MCWLMTDFWNHTTDGLGVFGSTDLFRNARLQRPMPEFASVAGGFYVKPLLHIVQSAGRFQVLSINRRDRIAAAKGFVRHGPIGRRRLRDGPLPDEIVVNAGQRDQRRMEFVDLLP